MKWEKLVLFAGKVQEPAQSVLRSLNVKAELREGPPKACAIWVTGSHE